jgi:hypothetical protein
MRRNSARVRDTNPMGGGVVVMRRFLVILGVMIVAALWAAGALADGAGSTGVESPARTLAVGLGSIVVMAMGAGAVLMILGGPDRARRA